jgi:hypothetical protein
MDSVAFRNSQFAMLQIKWVRFGHIKQISGNSSGHQHPNALPTYQIGLHISVRQDQVNQTTIDRPDRAGESETNKHRGRTMGPVTLLRSV